MSSGLFTEAGAVFDKDGIAVLTYITGTSHVLPMDNVNGLYDL